MWHNIKLQHPCYGYGIYTTTKHALKGLAECLRFELLSLNIRVTLCCPWFAKTPLLPEGQSILLAIHAILFSSSLCGQTRRVSMLYCQIWNTLNLFSAAHERNRQNIESIHLINRCECREGCSANNPEIPCYEPHNVNPLAGTNSSKHNIIASISWGWV